MLAITQHEVDVMNVNTSRDPARREEDPDEDDSVGLNHGY